MDETHGETVTNFHDVTSDFFHSQVSIGFLSHLFIGCLVYLVIQTCDAQHLSLLAALHKLNLLYFLLAIVCNNNTFIEAIYMLIILNKSELEL